MMQQIWLPACLLATTLAAGCPETPKPVAPQPADRAATTAKNDQLSDDSPSSLAVSRPADDPAAVSALEALGCRLTRNDAGSVTKLEVVSADLKDADLLHLKGLPSLVDIDLAKSSITDDGLAILDSLPNLKALGLQRCNLITDDGLQHLESVPNLERLYLLYTLIGNAGMDHVAQLKHLKLLDLRGAKVSNEGLAKLREHPTLVDIKLRAVSIDDDALPHLATIKQLKSIEAEDAAITGSELGQLAVLTDLQKLNLMRTYVSEVEFETLKGLTKLRDVRLRGTATRSSVINSLLASKDSLVYLDLTECPVSDDELAPLEQFQKLETLEIWQTNLGDAGLAQIAKLTNLKTLDVSKCKNVTSAGVPELLKLAKLETLNLSETGIDDAALDKLLAMHHLKSLDVRLTSVTPDAVARFQATVPGCKVTK